MDSKLVESTVDDSPLGGAGQSENRDMSTVAIGKECEIAKLLLEGIPPVEIIHKGYARGTVYKVNRRVKEGGTPLTAKEVSDHRTVAEADEEVETDREVHLCHAGHDASY